MNNKKRQHDALNRVCRKDKFCLPSNTIYLDGNSLGPMPKVAEQRAIDVVKNQWAKDLITSWNKHSWIDLPQTVGEQNCKGDWRS